MVAVSRFVEFSVSAQTERTGASTSATCKGTRGFSRGTGLSQPGNDTFTITKDSNDDLTITINGESGGEITLASGTNLDPRFVARDIAYKIRQKSSSSNFKYASCEWVGGGGTNKNNNFIIYTGQLGNNTGANKVQVTAGTNDARATLGWPGTETAGADPGGGYYSGTITVSGGYGGQFDDQYDIMINNTEQIGAVSKGRAASPTCTVDGVYMFTPGGANDDYTITIDTTNGDTAGNGTNSVPQFSVSDSPGSDDQGAVEILYWDHWYKVGALGLKAKWSEGVFENGDTYTFTAYPASGTAGLAVGAAKYIWSSDKGDSSKIHSVAPVTTQTTGTQLGTRGVTISFSNTDTLTTGEHYHVTCVGPQYTDSDTTQLNFGNVTVSTTSAVKVVWFELISGAVAMSTVKFSLEDDGSFQHHDQGSNDTKFHFGTSGAGNPAYGGGPGTNSQYEFSVDSTNSQGDITSADIDSDTPTVKVYASKEDLAVVASADLAQSIGNFQGGVVSDFVFLAILLGANETGANSTINYRMYFDFS